MTSSQARTERARFCRVTVLAPRARLDVALPTDLTAAELVPMLRELAGESGGAGPPSGRAAYRDGGAPGYSDDGADGRAGYPAGGAGYRAAGPGTPPGGAVAPAAWCLAAVAGAEMPPGATLGSLGVLDGDLLRLRPRSEAPPPPVFDDPVDAVAEVVPAADGIPGPWARAGWDAGGAPPAVRPWDARCRRRAGLCAAALATVLAAALLAAARGTGPQADPVAAVAAGLAALGALAAAARTAVADRVAAVVLAAGSVPLAAAAGLAAVPGAPAAGHLLLAAALAAAAAACALAVLGEPEPLLVGAVVAATSGALAALLGTVDAAPPAGLAAGAAALAVAALPMLPRISVALAGLPAPVVPTTPADMLAADARWQLDAADDIRHHAWLAHVYLGGSVLGASLVAGIGAAVSAAAGGPGGAVFAAAVVAVLLLRSRSYATALASAAPLAAGLGAAVVLLGALPFAGPAGTVGALGLLVAAAVAVGLVRYGTEPGRREASPVVRRTVDVIEAVLVVATFPLALWVLDLYRAVQGL